MARILLIGALIISLSPPVVMVVSIASSDGKQASSTGTGGTDATEAPPVVAPPELTADSAQEATDKLTALTNRANRFLMRFKKAPLTPGVPNDTFESAASDVRKAFLRWSDDHREDALDSDRRLARAYETTLQRAASLAANPDQLNVEAYNASLKRLYGALRG